MSVVFTMPAPEATKAAFFSAKTEIIPMLIGATVGEVERELVLQTLGAVRRQPDPCRARAGNIGPHAAEQDRNMPPMASLSLRMRTRRVSRGTFIRLLLRRLDVAEREQQREVVDDLERAADHQRQAGEARRQQHARDRRADAEARLRGTAVTLAAAGRSAGVTTAIT